MLTREQKRLNYWKKQLENVAPTQLPADYIAELPNKTSKKITFTLPTALMQQAEQQFTGFSAKEIFLATFLIALHAYTHETDLCVGFFETNTANGLPIRLPLSLEDTFADLLKTTQTTVKQAVYHAIPLETLFKQSLSSTTRAILKFTAPFNILYAYQTHFQVQGDLGLSIQVLTDNIYEGYIEFDTRLFNDAFVYRLIHRLQETLQFAIQHSSKAICQWPLLINEEKKYFVTQFASASMETLPSLMAVFNEQALAYPTQEALVFHDGQTRKHLTYAELQIAINQLANYLKEKSIDNGRVGVSVTRSLHLFIAILAVFQSGLTLVTLETNNKEKIEANIRSADLAFILTDDQTDKLITTLEKETLNLAAHETQTILRHENYAKSFVDVKPNTPAYIMYTSGTTGGSKGVVLSYGALANLLHGLKAEGFPAHTKILCTAAATFDALLYDVVVAILTGGALHFTVESMRFNIETLNTVIKKEKINVAVLLPEVISLLKFAPLTHLVSMGAALHLAKLRAWQAACPQTIVTNEFGTTETGIKLTRQILEDNNDPNLIGMPIPNMHCVILSPRKQLCPLGVQGELYVAGAGVALGYLNDETLTQRKFIYLRFDAEQMGFLPCEPNDPSAVRFYATGDAASFQLTHDQQLSIRLAGRTDRQVKIHGVRLDLDAVSQTLRAHSAINDIEVLPNSEKTALIAFIVPQDKNATATELLDLMRKQFPLLPAVAIPTHCMLIDEHLPLTSNGKVDTKILQALYQAKPLQTIKPAQVKHTALENALIRLWADKLGIEKNSIQLTTTFKAAGGHSLFLPVILEALNAMQAYPLSEPLNLLDLSPDMTIQDLAKRIEPLIPKVSFIPLPEGVKLTEIGLIFLSKKEKNRTKTR